MSDQAAAGNGDDTTAAQEIRPGDRVTLRGGTGPVMAVDRVEGGRAFVVWFDGKGEVRAKDFAAHVLDVFGGVC